MKLVRKRQTERVILASVKKTRGFIERGIGWMGQRNPAEAGLWIEPCRSIHTCFMRFPLDVFFVDRNGRITRIFRGLYPWRLASGGKHSYAVLEIASGVLSGSALREGDRIRLIPNPPRFPAKQYPRPESA